MKRILNISIMIVLVAGMIVLLAFTDIQHHSMIYKNFRIDVLNSTQYSLITKDEIHDLVKKNFGEIEGAPSAGINLLELEETVLKNPYVSSCEVFQTIDGGLVLKARVREPLVRIINQDGQQFYLDMNGWMMPLNHEHIYPIIIANGYIDDTYISLEKSEKPLSNLPDSSVIHHIFYVAFHISRDFFLKSFIDQIYINEKHEIELVPKIGSQTIFFGTSENAKEKLENLKIFYQKVMNRMDWTVYKSINVKYKNQVVCSKYKLYE
jgi:cell division protein FtsQ